MTNKTPEQMAKEYGDCFMPGEDSKHYTSLLKEVAFLAGYEAAKDQLADTSKEMNSPEILDSWNSSNNSNGWISVKERLPEIAPNRFVSDDVLWISRYGEMHVSCLEQLRHEIRVDWGEAGLLKLDQVTHWMPLPEAPKE